MQCPAFLSTRHVRFLISMPAAAEVVGNWKSRAVCGTSNVCETSNACKTSKLRRKVRQLDFGSQRPFNGLSGGSAPMQRSLRAGMAQPLRPTNISPPRSRPIVAPWSPILHRVRLALPSKRQKPPTARSIHRVTRTGSLDNQHFRCRRRGRLDFHGHLPPTTGAPCGLARWGGMETPPQALFGIPSNIENTIEPAGRCQIDRAAPQDRSSCITGSIKLHHGPGIFSRPVMNDADATRARLSARPKPPPWPRRR